MSTLCNADRLEYFEVLAALYLFAIFPRIKDMSSSLFTLVGTMFLLGHAFSGSATHEDDPSVILAAKKRERVENGVAFDKATIVLKDGHKTLVVPEEARIERIDNLKGIEIYMKKELYWGTGAKETISIRNERKEIGCVLKSEDGKTVLATFGEYAGPEQYLTMTMVIRMPKTQVVGTRKGLSGPRIMKRLPSSPPNRPRIVPGVGGWDSVEEHPDPNRTAGSDKDLNKSGK